MEPEFISQCGEPLTPDERRAWVRKRAAEAKERGATFARFSIHPTEPNLILFEGWKERPADEGDQRWQMVASSDGPDLVNVKLEEMPLAKRMG